MNALQEVDADYLNAMVNDPEIYPLIKGDAQGPMDLEPILNDPRNFALMNDHGGWLFVACQIGFYEANPIFKPQSRDIWALPLSREALKRIFTETEAVEVFTRVPFSDPATKAILAVLGFREEFVAKYGWSDGATRRPADVMSLQIQDWIRTAPGFDETSQELHAAFEREFIRSGILSYAPPRGEIANRYIGAAAEMIFNGQPQKGVVFYNRFAAMSGLAPVALTCLNPTTLLIAGSTFEVHGRSVFLISPSTDTVN